MDVNDRMEEMLRDMYNFPDGSFAGWYERTARWTLVFGREWILLKDNPNER